MKGGADLCHGSDASVLDVWVEGHNGDGLAVEAQNASGAWVRLRPLAPAYEPVDGLVTTAWRDQTGSATDYVYALAGLTAWIGRVPLRHVSPLPPGAQR